MEIRDLRQFRGLDQELLLGDEAGNQFDFGFVQMKLPTVEVAIHVRVGEEDFGGAAFDDYVEDFRALEFVERLRRENHGGVVFSPGLECFDHVPLDAGFFKNTHASSMKNALKTELIWRSAMTALARCRM